MEKWGTVYFYLVKYYVVIYYNYEDYISLEKAY